MRWTIEDAEKYEEAREYIDTVIIPAFAVDPDQIGVAAVREQKWLEEICVYTERQLTGRVMLVPTLYVFGREVAIETLQPAHFAHIWFVTTNERIREKLVGMNFQVYFLERKEDEEDLANMVREGKKLTQAIMDDWKK